MALALILFFYFVLYKIWTMGEGLGWAGGIGEGYKAAQNFNHYIH